MESCIAELRGQDRLQIFTQAQIMSAHFKEKEWHLATTQGEILGQRLVVAQNPWDASHWLGKDLWPSRLLNVSSKTKPVSMVILSLMRTSGADSLPETLLIPAEEVQVIADKKQICFQATLNYELTVQAPAVVKAVKRLKRAHKKLEQVYPDLQISGEHIALIPVAWAQAVTPSELRWNDKLEGSQYQKPHLAFCGDAYGAEFDCDLNLLGSLKALLEAMS